MKVHFVSDLLTEAGDGFLPGILKGGGNRGSRLTWPETLIPRGWWELWGSVLRNHLVPHQRTMGGGTGHQIPSAMGNRDMSLIMRDGMVYEKYGKCVRRPN